MTLATTTAPTPSAAPQTDAAATPESPATARRRRRLRAARTVVLAVLLGLLATVAAVPQDALAFSAHGTTRYERSIEYRVLSTINSERRAHHLVPLTMNSQLITSARRHDVTMARWNRMSHQLPGERFFASRMLHAGYHWHWAGENIGWNSRMTTYGVLALQSAMYHERAPYNGHRLNILNPHFRNVGVDVYLDHAHHKVWLTTDFGRH